jgi:hypothetical protein
VYSSVAVTVGKVSHLRASYDEIDSPAAMRADAVAAGRALRLDRVARAVAAGAPKRDIAVDQETARLAEALHLYLA